jgi:RNA polymerase sigma factor (sigma-70 family)
MPEPTHTQHFCTPLIDGSDGVLDACTDEQLVARLRQGRHSAFETLAARYQSRLLWFCWKILGSKEDAEDALQDVFAAAFRALLADEREIQVRPWLYRIARNRCINELRRARTVGVDALDDQHAAKGGTLVEKLVSRQQFRELVDDVHALPDTQRTALLLREIDGFAYQQIATAMDTTVSGVKSLLVRARAGLRDSSAARDATCAAPRRAATQKNPERRRSHSKPRAITYQAARAVAGVAA